MVMPMQAPMTTQPTYFAPMQQRMSMQMPMQIQHGGGTEAASISASKNT